MSTFLGLQVPEPLLVVLDDTEPCPDLAGLRGDVVRLSELTGEKVRKGQASVLLITADRASLRRIVALLPRMGQVRVAAAWLHADSTPVVVRPRPEWPPLTAAVARTVDSPGGVLSVLRFDAPVPAHRVLTQIAYEAAPTPTGHGGVVVGYLDRAPVAGLDVSAPILRSEADAGSQERDVPPDVVLADAAVDLPVHHVTDRAPVLVAAPACEPVDEFVFNPMGWRKTWQQGDIDASALSAGGRLRTDELARAREHRAVRVRLGQTPTATVAALAMSGVPLLAEGADPALSPAVSAALAVPVDVSDPLAREEHSLRVRRAGLQTHSTLAFREEMARRAGVRFVGAPSVSVLLPTMRPDQLDFALRQVARQDTEVELVLATHGFRADEAVVRDALGGKPYRLLDFSADTFFGDVLDSAARAASGDVLLKMDDDDWYSPRVVRDLMLARRYSGADVVGMPSEFVYLAARGTTVRRNHPSELFNRFVAGGTIFIDRAALSAVGGFRRVRRFVDAQLLDAVLAGGGRIYRAHGLGYVLRRNASGHTWNADDEAFRRPEITEAEWDGFRPSAELEPAQEDLP